MSGRWRLLTAGMRGRRRAMVGFVFWSVVQGLPALSTGLLLAKAVDDGFLAGAPMRGMQWLAALLGVQIVAAAANRALIPHLADLVEPVRDHLVRHVVTATLRRAVTDTIDSGHGDAVAVTQLTGQVEGVRQLLTGLLRSSRQIVVSLLAGLVGLALLAPVLLVIMLPPLLLMLVLFAILLPALFQRSRAAMLAGEAVSTSGGALLSGLRDVLACQASGRATAELRGRIDAEVAAAKASGRAFAGRSVLISIALDIPLVALLVVAPFLLSSGQLSVGELVGAVAYVTLSLESALKALVSSVGGTVLQLMVTLERLAGIHSARTEPPVDATALTPYQPDGTELHVTSLTFAYGPHSEPVLRDLDLTVPDGEHLAIVGPSGIGKSTLTALLAGLVEPQHGQVLFGGVPVHRISPPTRHQRIVLIPQQAYVFAGTLRDNVCYLRPDADDAAVAHSAHEVGLAALADTLGGWDAMISPGELSAGQRQLIALTRAHLAFSAITILDEATCHLDAIAEARAEEAFRRRGTTLVVVAHRISSAMRADRILLLDGLSPHLGSHDELVHSSAVYARLVGHWGARGRSATEPGQSSPSKVARHPTAACRETA
ncbi:MAG: ATP-binding cassette domain-containing protein [Pseudonocardiaceae bacterium]